MLLICISFANPIAIKVEIMEQVAMALTGKRYPKACFIGIKLPSSYFDNIIPSSCEDADVVFTSINTLRYRKPLVVTNYDILLRNPYAVAGMYWLDGRYQVVFVKERLREFNIHLLKEFRYYEISQSSLY